MVTKKTTINPLHNKEIKVGYRIVKIKVTPANFNNAATEGCELHAIVSDMGETGKGGVLSDEDTEEKFVLTQANALTALLFDNKWFVQYLYDKVMQ